MDDTHDQVIAQGLLEGHKNEAECLKEQIRMCRADLDLRTRERDHAWNTIEELKTRRRVDRGEIIAPGQERGDRYVCVCCGVDVTTGPHTWRECAEKLAKRKIQRVYTPNPKAIRVSLSMLEAWPACFIGVARQIQALRDKSPPNAGAPEDDDWSKHIEGALGELAFCKLLGIYWTGAERRQAEDAHGWEVRTRSEPHYELIVRLKDPDDSKVALVTGRNLVYDVHGWMKSGDAKTHDEWVHNHGGRPSAWFVPQQALIPFPRKQNR